MKANVYISSDNYGCTLDVENTIRKWAKAMGNFEPKLARIEVRL